LVSPTTFGYGVGIETDRATVIRRSTAATDLGIVDALVQLSFVVQAILAEVAALHGLSITQVRLCGALRDRELKMAQLATVLDLDRSSATGLVDRAERRRLVRRRSVPDDGRSVSVGLSAGGRRIADVFAAQVHARVMAIVEPLTEEHRARLSRLASAVVAGDAEARGLDLSEGLLGPVATRVVT
jgi:DNA-binding MarR family transcriptional regulator